MAAPGFWSHQTSLRDSNDRRIAKKNIDDNNNKTKTTTLCLAVPVPTVNMDGSQHIAPILGQDGAKKRFPRVNTLVTKREHDVASADVFLCCSSVFS